MPCIPNHVLIGVAAVARMGGSTVVEVGEGRKEHKMRFERQGAVAGKQVARVEGRKGCHGGSVRWKIT
jgi:hypothetical protein